MAELVTIKEFLTKYREECRKSDKYPATYAKAYLGLGLNKTEEECNTEFHWDDFVNMSTQDPVKRATDASELIKFCADWYVNYKSYLALIEASKSQGLNVIRARRQDKEAKHLGYYPTNWSWFKLLLLDIKRNKFNIVTEADQAAQRRIQSNWESLSDDNLSSDDERLIEQMELEAEDIRYGLSKDAKMADITKTTINGSKYALTDNLYNENDGYAWPDD